MTLLAIIPTCFECGSRLRLRENRSTGEKFLGCSAYPCCKATEPYRPLEQELARQIVELEEALADSQSKALRLPGASANGLSTDDVSKRLKDLIFRFHPDRNPGGVDGDAITRELIALRFDLEVAA